MNETIHKTGIVADLSYRDDANPEKSLGQGESAI